MKPSSVSALWPCPWALSKSNTVRTPQCKNCLGKPLRNAKLTSSTTDTPPQRPDETKMEPEASGNRKSKTSQCTIAQTTKCNRTNNKVQSHKLQCAFFWKSATCAISQNHMKMHTNATCAIAQTTKCNRTNYNVHLSVCTNYFVRFVPGPGVEHVTFVKASPALSQMWGHKFCEIWHLSFPMHVYLQHPPPRPRNIHR